MRTVKTTMELDASLHRTLRVKAALENRSMNDIVVAALQEHLQGFCLAPGMLEVETVYRSAPAEQLITQEVTHHG